MWICLQHVYGGRSGRKRAHHGNSRFTWAFSEELSMLLECSLMSSTATPSCSILSCLSPLLTTYLHHIRLNLSTWQNIYWSPWENVKKYVHTNKHPFKLNWITLVHNPSNSVFTKPHYLLVRLSLVPGKISWEVSWKLFRPLSAKKLTHIFANEIN